MFKARLILAFISTSVEEIAIYTIWRWGLPRLNIHLSLSVLITVMTAWATFSAIFFLFVTKVLRKQTLVGLPTMVGSKGKVIDPLNPVGLIKIKGETWQATSVEGNMDKGEEITVVRQDGLKLIVRRSRSLTNHEISNNQPTH